MIAIAVDDEPPALQIIAKYCEQIDFVDLKKTFTNPLEALKYIRKFPVDLLFIDIQMPDINGMDFFRRVNPKPIVVFTTAFSEFAVEGFDLNATDYLLKPFAFERFQKAAEKAYEKFKQQHNTNVVRYISLRSNYSLVKININDIELIESLDDYVTIYTVSGRKVVSRMTLKTIMAQLPDGFARVHRSYIVPLDKIVNVRNKVIDIGNKKVPVGIKYERDFFEKYINQV
ncbi:MAG: LytTR family DNA-binding domain-containing protein [Paludibacter sp.]|nr:LytTR family DNA-binding domain-containing protein [Paludibacter sp.]